MKKEYLFLVVAIVVLGGLLFYQKRDRTNYKLPKLEQLDAANADRLLLSRGPKTAELVKTDGKWQLKPQRWRANQERARQMVDELAKLKVVALISDKKNYRLYELDPEKGLKAALYQGDKLLREVIIGKCSSSFRQTYIRLKDDDRVYQALGNLKNNFFVEVSELRDKTVMRIAATERDKIDRIVLEREKDGRSETLTMLRVPEKKAGKAGAGRSEKEGQKEQEKKGGNGKVVGWQLENGRPVSAAAVKSLLNILSDLRCQGYLDDYRRDAFKQPWYKITLKAGDREYTLALLAEKDGVSPALSSEAEAPFKLPGWRVKDIVKDFSAYTGEKSKVAKSKKLPLPEVGTAGRKPGERKRGKTNQKKTLFQKGESSVSR